ncbi:MAG TPA: ferredoxin--NADP reductase [Gemmatales bacterium]|nr:ferredoxin--NADP reductase [Gemmatales bacterium]HMP58016.1 ferredoxin--NADP reductase [Gemmatales bacterium]
MATDADGLDRAALRQKHYNATVSRLVRPHADLMIMRVTPDFPVPAHTPGQYTTLGLGYWENPATGLKVAPASDPTKLLRRSYSISHPLVDEQGEIFPPGAPPGLEFYVVLVRDTGAGEAGALTSRLITLQEGDRVHLGERIAGHYSTAQVQPTDTVVFLSTGTGEAPHNYMIWDLLRRGHTGPIVAVCCVRFRRDLGYLEAYERTVKRYSQVHYITLTTREPGPGQGKRYIQDILLDGSLEQTIGQRLEPATTHVFLCGNPNMIGVPRVDRTTRQKTYPSPVGVCELLEQRGFVADQAALKIKGNIHFEEYW